MAWTSPPTFSSGQVVTAADLNSYLRDNTNYLLARNYGFLRYLGSYSSTSTSFVDVDATNLSLTVTINSGRALVLIGLHLSNASGGGPHSSIDCIVDSTTRIGDATEGLVFQYGDATITGAMGFFMGVATGLSVGSHTFKIQYKTDSGANAARIGYQNGALQNHPINFLVLEI